MTTELKAQTIVSSHQGRNLITYHSVAYLIGIHWKGNPLKTIWQNVDKFSHIWPPSLSYIWKKETLKILPGLKLFQPSWMNPFTFKWNTKYYVFSNLYALKYNSLTTKNKRNGNKPKI